MYFKEPHMHLKRAPYAPERAPYAPERAPYALQRANVLHTMTIDEGLSTACRAFF